MDDKYIKILKYARENLDTGVTFNDGIDNIKKMFNLAECKDGINDQIYNKLFNKVFDSEISNSTEVGYEKARFFMKIEAYFNLLEYEELKEARESARQARKYALSAMAIALIIGCFQIWQGTLSHRHSDQHKDFIHKIKSLEEQVQHYKVSKSFSQNKKKEIFSSSETKQVDTK